MKIEHVHTADSVTDPLALRIKAYTTNLIKDFDAFELFIVDAADFKERLIALMVEEFPDEPNALDSIPAWHAFCSSGSKHELQQLVSKEAQLFAETQLELFMKSVSSNSDF